MDFSLTPNWMGEGWGGEKGLKGNTKTEDRLALFTLLRFRFVVAVLAVPIGDKFMS